MLCACVLYSSVAHPVRAVMSRLNNIFYGKIIVLNTIVFKQMHQMYNIIPIYIDL